MKNDRLFQTIKYWNLFREIAFIAYDSQIVSVEEQVSFITRYMEMKKERQDIYDFSIMFDERLWPPSDKNLYKNLMMIQYNFIPIAELNVYYMMIRNPLKSIGYDPISQMTFDPFNVKINLEE